MSQKANLLTIRKHNFFLNLLNLNTNMFLYGQNVLNSLKRLGLKKNVLLINENANFYSNKMYLNFDLFFSTKKLKAYKKLKRIINTNKENLFYNSALLDTIKFLQVNFIVTKFKVLNKEINKIFLLYLFKKLKIHIKYLFERRYSLFIDFLKLTTLYFNDQISTKVYLSILAEIFKYLKKKQHAKFISFIKKLFSLLIFESKKYQVKNKIYLKGVKFRINGRIKGKAKASSFYNQIGHIPVQSLSTKIDFAKARVYTQNFGVLGFKIWVYKS
jgi:small subunit ribosomal protein S3